MQLLFILVLVSIDDLKLLSCTPVKKQAVNGEHGVQSFSLVTLQYIVKPVSQSC